MLLGSNVLCARNLRSSVFSSHYRHFVASTSVCKAAVVVDGTDVEKAEKKTSRARIWFVAVAAASVVGALLYPSLVPPATKPPPVTVPPPRAPDIVPPPPTLSAQEVLFNRLADLKAELVELRKSKKDKFVDMKKKHIKDEIRIIETGLAKLEKS